MLTSIQKNKNIYYVDINQKYVYGYHKSYISELRVLPEIKETFP